MTDPSPLPPHGRWTPLGTRVPQSFTMDVTVDSLGFPSSLSYICRQKTTLVMPFIWTPESECGAELPTHFQALTSQTPSPRTHRSLGLPHLAGLGWAGLAGKVVRPAYSKASEEVPLSRTIGESSEPIHVPRPHQDPKVAGSLPCLWLSPHWAILRFLILVPLNIISCFLSLLCVHMLWYSCGGDNSHGIMSLCQPC